MKRKLTWSVIRLAQVAAVAGAMSLSSGCAVYMAASGNEAPNLGVVKAGSPRNDIEYVLGSPKTSFTTDTGSAATYHYRVGDEPSPVRAIGHGLLDVATFGVWELVGTPIEAGIDIAKKDGVRVVEVEYDTNGVATSVVKQ